MLDWPDMKDEKPNALWPSFCDWAEENGIGTYVEDYEAWWDCYMAGAKQALNMQMDSLLTAAFVTTEDQENEIDAG